MDDTRIATELWVSAYLRRSDIEGDGAVLLRRGDTSRGTVLLKLVRPDGWRVLSQARDGRGELGWLVACTGTEAEADAHMARAISRDPDSWAIEIIDRQSRHPLEGKTI